MATTPAIHSARRDAEWLSINEAAALVGRSRRTIYHWITRRLVVTRRTAAGWLQIHADSLFQDEPGNPAYNPTTTTTTSPE